MKIGLKFCGGCNPVIDRSALVQKIRKLLPPGFRLVTEHSAAPYEKAVLVCGCPTACADNPDLRRLAKKWIVISGPRVDLEEIPEDKIANTVIQKLSSHAPPGA